MSIPVVPEHKKFTPDCDDCALTDECVKAYSDETCPLGCMPDCPACAVEANNKAWAKYLVGLDHEVWDEGLNEVEGVFIPVLDWEQIKKLAEEKVEWEMTCFQMS